MCEKFLLSFFANWLDLDHNNHNIHMYKTLQCHSGSLLMVYISKDSHDIWRENKAL